MRLAYLAAPLLPALGVVALLWIVVRAVTVRVVWRAGTTDRLDDRAA